MGKIQSIALIGGLALVVYLIYRSGASLAGFLGGLKFPEFKFPSLFPEMKPAFGSPGTDPTMPQNYSPAPMTTPMMAAMEFAMTTNADIFKFNPPGTVFYGVTNINMGKGLSYVEAFKQMLITREQFIAQGIDIDKLLKANLAIDMTQQGMMQKMMQPVMKAITQVMGSFQSQTGQIFQMFGGGLGAGQFKVTSNRPLSDILREYPGISASKAADILAMRTMNYPAGFNFGTNTGQAFVAAMGRGSMAQAMLKSQEAARALATRIRLYPNLVYKF